MFDLNPDKLDVITPFKFNSSNCMTKHNSNMSFVGERPGWTETVEESATRDQTSSLFKPSVHQTLGWELVQEVKTMYC